MGYSRGQMKMLLRDRERNLKRLKEFQQDNKVFIILKGHGIHGTFEMECMDYNQLKV